MMMTKTIAALALCALSACGSDAVMQPVAMGSKACATPKCTTHLAVTSAFSFAKQVPEGVTRGFDLDGRQSDESDDVSCGQADFTSPEGTPGIDNQFVLVWDLLVMIAGDAVEGLIRGAINDGTLLLMVRLEGVDDPAHDDCVDVTIIPAVGKPFVGTDGLITTGQSFDPNPAVPITRIPCGVMRDGVVEAGPFEAELPFQILIVNTVLHAHNGRLRAQLHPDGRISAQLGAGIEIQQIIDVAYGAPGFPADLVEVLVKGIADLVPTEGKCTQISATMLIEAVRAHMYPGNDV
jgi:hypothetical protein